MGLDMYLSAKRSLYKMNPADWQVAQAVRSALGVDFESGNLEYTRIEIEVAYWRKDNAIHSWFVGNVQDGEDNCADYYVSRDQLKELAALCQKVLDTPDKAEELMATASGFFFGSTDYDEWYFQGLRDTIESVNKALTLPDVWEFSYHSSW